MKGRLVLQEEEHDGHGDDADGHTEAPLALGDDMQTAELTISTVLSLSLFSRAVQLSVFGAGPGMLSPRFLISGKRASLGSPQPARKRAQARMRAMSGRCSTIWIA